MIALSAGDCEIKGFLKYSNMLLKKKIRKAMIAQCVLSLTKKHT